MSGYFGRMIQEDTERVCPYACVHVRVRVRACMRVCVCERIRTDIYAFCSLCGVHECEGRGFVMTLPYSFCYPPETLATVVSRHPISSLLLRSELFGSSTSSTSKRILW